MVWFRVRVWGLGANVVKVRCLTYSRMQCKCVCVQVYACKIVYVSVIRHQNSSHRNEVEWSQRCSPGKDCSVITFYLFLKSVLWYAYDWAAANHQLTWKLWVYYELHITHLGFRLTSLFVCFGCDFEKVVISSYVIVICVKTTSQHL